MTEQQTIETLATKVMGWSQWDGLWCKDRSHTTFICKVADWDPLKNIADAWQVVERLLEGYLHFDLSTDEDGWWATFKMVDKTFIDTKEWEASGDTPQEAICTAAMELVA